MGYVLVQLLAPINANDKWQIYCHKGIVYIWFTGIEIPQKCDFFCILDLFSYDASCNCLHKIHQGLASNNRDKIGTSYIYIVMFVYKEYISDDFVETGFEKAFLL